MYGDDMRPQFTPPSSPEGLTDNSQLLAIEQIKRTKAFYCFFIDTKDWAGYQSLFTADAVLEIPAHGEAPAARVEGAEAIAQFVGKSVEGVVSSHQCHTPIIDFTSADTASVVWAMEDMLRFPEAAPINLLHGMGHYFEKYRKSPDGRWCISHLRLERMRLDLS